MEQTGELNQTILESISDGVFTIDEDWRITSFNKAAEFITGVSREEAMGNMCCDVFRSSMCGDCCALRETMTKGHPVIGRSGYIIRANGDQIPISVSTAVLKDANGTIRGGAETFRDLSEIDALRQALDQAGRVGDLVSHSPVMQNILEILPAIAASPSTVLITGESGTGKEVVARTIHQESPRQNGPFVAVNCGALPDTLLESELFGYLRGAFTGAVQDREGRLSKAAGGTIFLDEIGDISPAFQVRLLRALQEKTFEPLGSSESLPLDARVIAATNRDLFALMKSGDFREDLYYRINIVRVELPPLRKRQQDIPLLADHFIRRYNLLQDKQVEGLAPEVLSFFMAYEWPGNVRELENVIERAFILCDNGEIGLQHLPADMLGGRGESMAKANVQAAHELLDQQSIMTALKQNQYNRAAAAKALGIHKTTLFRRMRRLGMALPERDGRHRQEP